MTGHAPHLLRDCAHCPPWEPRRATANIGTVEHPVFVCNPHLFAADPEFAPVGAFA